uniref:Uncharacterized protein n=1 Tax=Cacopsylla melanoneura TaxID=428564 RepID=A0A8D8S0U1_9HEMI
MYHNFYLISRAVFVVWLVVALWCCDLGVRLDSAGSTPATGFFFSFFFFVNILTYFFSFFFSSTYIIINSNVPTSFALPLKKKKKKKTTFFWKKIFKIKFKIIPIFPI